jgi:hypothetical protein
MKNTQVSMIMEFITNSLQFKKGSQISSKCFEYANMST